MRAHEALQMQVDLRNHVMTPPFVAGIDRYLCSAAFKAENRNYLGIDVSSHPGINEYRSLGLGREWSELEHRVLGEANTYVVSESMNALIKRASDDLDDDMILEEYNLPSPTGFLVFDNPFPYQELNGEYMWAKAVSWAQVTFDRGMMGEPNTPREGKPHKGVVVHFYVDHEDGRNRESAQVRALFGRLSMQHRIEIRFEQKIGKMRAPEYSFQESEAAIGPVKHIMTIWFMMQQTITETVHETFSEKNERRWVKKGVKAPVVRMVTLRRRQLRHPESAPQGEGERQQREWQHQWYVKGFWQRVPYGPRSENLRRWVYKHPSVRGPEDKPFLDQKKVYKLSR